MGGQLVHPAVLSLRVVVCFHSSRHWPSGGIEMISETEDSYRQKYLQEWGTALE